MIKKLAILGISTILLGGCNPTSLFTTNNAAQDEQTEVMTTPAPAAPDPVLEAIPPTATSTDATSLEKDINTTVILDEDPVF